MELEKLNLLVYEMTNEFLKDGYEPLAVAAMYTMVAMQIYKTTMSEEDYNAMVDVISNSRDKVKKLLDLDKNTIMGKSDTVH